MSATEKFSKLPFKNIPRPFLPMLPTMLWAGATRLEPGHRAELESEPSATRTQFFIVSTAAVL